MAEYKIHHCPVRKRRGLPCWGVERVGEVRMIGSFHTEAEAKALIAELKAKDGQ